MIITVVGIIIGVVIIVWFTRQMTIYSYRPNLRYRRDIKPRMSAANKQRTADRDRTLSEGIQSIWQPRIRKAERKVRRHNARVVRGKNPAKNYDKARRHGEQAEALQSGMLEELGLSGLLHKAARSGDAKAQRLTGHVNPSTGHTTGGIGRAGLKPSHKMPKAKTPKQKSSGGGKLKKWLIG
jgi:hypothetical protein